MVIPVRVWLPWGLFLVAALVAAVAVQSARSRADDAAGALEVARARAAGLTVAERVPLITAPPYSKVRQEFPAAKPTDHIVVRTEYVPVMAPVAGNPSGEQPNCEVHESEPTVPSCVLTSDDRVAIGADETLWRLPAGTRVLEGEATVTRERGAAVIARAPIKADLSRWLTVAPLSPGERPRWWVMLAAGLTEQVRPWALAAGGKGHWGGALGVDRIVFPDRSEKWNRKVGAAWTARW